MKTVLKLLTYPQHERLFTNAIWWIQLQKSKLQATKIHTVIQ